MTEADVHGPVDFVLLEFREDRLTGRAADELLRLVDDGVIRLFDVAFVGKTADGEIYAVDLAAEALAEQLGLNAFAGARSGLLADDDVREAAQVMEPGTLAALIVYENSWAIPFIAAARESGAELVASARIPAADVMAALDALEQAAEPLQPI
ncbi:MAG TPA: DUF6325 family protein [Nocardioides sp.]|uniref:DUF6325 family protein n=1 Tax=Nocardioides sp. TaxID=35761 RepID=UPI002D7E56E5|nr:DUF6325 family protein [Nocardioides sp.]HET6653311.1 DUF6325 family protein [Nocardioides sp.]